MLVVHIYINETHSQYEVQQAKIIRHNCSKKIVIYVIFNDGGKEIMNQRIQYYLNMACYIVKKVFTSQRKSKMIPLTHQLGKFIFKLQELTRSGKFFMKILNCKLTKRNRSNQKFFMITGHDYVVRNRCRLNSMSSAACTCVTQP